MKPAQYIFLNEGLGMSLGKAAAQAAHAAVEGYRLTANSTLVREWYKGKHHTKLVMSARDTEHLWAIERYLKDRFIICGLIIDEGRTEVPPITPTALGTAIVDRDDPHTAATFESFQTLKPPAPVLIPPSPYARVTGLDRLKGTVYRYDEELGRRR